MSKLTTQEAHDRCREAALADGWEQFGGHGKWHNPRRNDGACYSNSPRAFRYICDDYKLLGADATEAASEYAPDYPHDWLSRPFAVANSVGLVDNRVFAFFGDARQHARDHSAQGWLGECWVVRLVPMECGRSAEARP